MLLRFLRNNYVIGVTRPGTLFVDSEPIKRIRPETCKTQSACDKT